MLGVETTKKKSKKKKKGPGKGQGAPSPPTETQAVLGGFRGLITSARASRPLNTQRGLQC